MPILISYCIVTLYSLDYVSSLPSIMHFQFLLILLALKCLVRSASSWEKASSLSAMPMECPRLLCNGLKMEKQLPVTIYKE